MENKVLNTISEFNMLDGVNEVTVALSGGADSMALLYALLTVSKRLKLTVSAAHFNHKIRGAEAERDEAFVKAVCQKLGVKLYTGSADVPQFAADNGLSIELAARKLRYEFFDSIKTDAIATAHTASDNLETVLFNLTRGTALSGLCGIPAVRGKYIRPLINITRVEVENYCKINNIEYITDSTNLSDDYTRNNIRHNIVPLLKGINPSVEAALSRTTVSLLEDADFLEKSADMEYTVGDDGKLLVNKFSSLAPAVAKRVIVRYYTKECGTAPDFIHINNLYDICIKGGRCSISGNKTAISDRFSLKLVDNDKKVKIPIYDVTFSVSENDLFKNTIKVHNLLLKNAFDYDKIVGKLVQRTRMPGDKIKLANKNGTKSLKKLYTEYKVPLAEREYLPVIADDVGVVWICGIGVADRCAASKNSTKIYKITVNKAFLGDK